MTKLRWMEGEAVRKWLPHSDYNWALDEIRIVSDDPDVEPHVALSHEIAHRRLGHQGEGALSSEVDAWNETVYYLMRSGEWTPEAKEQAIWALSSYFAPTSDPEGEARQWISRAESRARRLLRRY